MPTYEYKCHYCGHQFEAFQKITDKPIEKCPQCSRSVKRLISSGVEIIFRGKGFYATDYRKNHIPKESHAEPACPKLKAGCPGCPTNPRDDRN